LRASEIALPVAEFRELRQLLSISIYVVDELVRCFSVILGNVIVDSQQPGVSLTRPDYFRHELILRRISSLDMTFPLFTSSSPRSIMRANANSRIMASKEMSSGSLSTILIASS
jgi:hypothetical protein